MPFIGGSESSAPLEHKEPDPVHDIVEDPDPVYDIVEDPVEDPVEDLVAEGDAEDDADEGDAQIHNNIKIDWFFFVDNEPIKGGVPIGICTNCNATPEAQVNAMWSSIKRVMSLMEEYSRSSTVFFLRATVMGVSEADRDWLTNFVDWHGILDEGVMSTFKNISFNVGAEENEYAIIPEGIRDYPVVDAEFDDADADAEEAVADELVALTE